MKRVVYAVFPALLAIVAPAISGQTPASPPPARAERLAAVAPIASPCPTIQVAGPAGRILRDGQPVTFGANIAGGDPNVTPTIVWNTSAGTIVGGQGTKSIQVDSTGAGSNREIVAELWVGGYAPECGGGQASASVRVAGPPSKVDEFGELSVEKESERLASFASNLPQANDHIVIIAYAGRTSVRNYTSTSLRRLKTQLTAAGIPSERLTINDGGFREEPAFELWLVPEGSEAPRPTPTVDRKEIVYPKTTPTRTAPIKKP
jgi:hypothetical protein